MFRNSMFYEIKDPLACTDNIANVIKMLRAVKTVKWEVVQCMAENSSQYEMESCEYKG